MARGCITVWQRIIQESRRMEAQFKKLDVNGRATSHETMRKIKQVVNDSSYKVAQECSVIVNYPKMHIEGRKVVLEQPLIMLPDCRLVSINDLIDIEEGRKK